MMWGFGGFAYLWMLLFCLGIAFLIAWAVRRDDSQEPPRNRAMEILEERFARGDVDAEEFEARRSELTR